MPDAAGKFKGISLPNRPEVKQCPFKKTRCTCLIGGAQHETCKFNDAYETRTNG